MTRRTAARMTTVVAITALATAVPPTFASAVPATRAPVQAKADAYISHQDRTLNAKAGILANDTGDVKTLVRHTDPAHGQLTLRPDGTFRYRPDAGFTGVDSFTYTVSDAVKLYSTHLAPLATIGGVAITGGGYGSSLYPVPGSTDEYYGLTDRGPNVDGPDGAKIEPRPDFDPAIGRFRLVGHNAVLEKVIRLKAADGTPQAYVGTDDTATATAALATAGITVVARSLDVDLGGLLTTLDPAGGFFGHDKVEGVATTNHGRTITVSNDSDFGMAGTTDAGPPYQLTPKVLPNGTQDDGEYLTINTSRLGDPTSTATVTLFVVPPGTHP